MSPFIIILEYVAVYAVSIILGWFTINPICYNLGKHYFKKVKWDRFLPRFVGALEQIMYTTSILIGKEEFVAVWLVLKLAGEWRQIDRPAGYAMYNIFLIGNSLSLMLAAATALFIKSLLPPLP